MKKYSYSRTASFIIVLLFYILGLFSGWWCYILLEDLMPAYYALFVADFIATIVVWFGGILYKNVSVYDPYWSVAPPVILSMWAVYKGVISIPAILLLISIWYWAIRLTGNWAYTFKGIDHEDWRYTKYRNSQSAFIFQIINFFGLNLMPTIVVFLAMLPGFVILESGTQASIFSYIGCTISISAATIQLIADNTAHSFRKQNPGQICKVGLWKHGRHPNYFGEIIMWWGVFVQYLAVGSNLWMMAGAIANTLLFLCISIPLMEGRQIKNKPGYAEYKKQTRMLI